MRPGCKEKNPHFERSRTSAGICGPTPPPAPGPNGRCCKIHLWVVNRFRSVNVKRLDSFCRLIPAQFRSQWMRQCGSGQTPAEQKMVEDLHRQRVLNFLDAFYSGDTQAALACCDADVDSITHAPI